MKKRLLALILSALLLINAVACNIVSAPENDDSGTLENTDTESESESEKNTEEMTRDNTETDPEESTLEDGTNTEESTLDYPEVTVEVNESTSENMEPDTIWSSGLYSSYVGSSTYIQKDNPILWVHVNEQYYYYIKKWNKAYPTTYDDSPDPGQCGTEKDNVAWIFTYEQEKSQATNAEQTIFKMVKIYRETDIQETSTLSLPIALKDGLSSIYCSMLDQNSGYLFVYGWRIGYYKQLRALAKTTDGGKNWTVLEYGEDWPARTSWEMITVSHFFDENKGIIVPRTSAGANVNAIYVTLDGGKKWFVVNANIPFNDYFQQLGSDRGYLELADFGFYDETYFLIFRLSGDITEGIYQQLASFSSPDLVNWTYVDLP